MFSLLVISNQSVYIYSEDSGANEASREKRERRKQRHAHHHIHATREERDLADYEH